MSNVQTNEAVADIYSQLLYAQRDLTGPERLLMRGINILRPGLAPHGAGAAEIDRLADLQAEVSGLRKDLQRNSQSTDENTRTTQSSPVRGDN
jgi:hypothetical protein